MAQRGLLPFSTLIAREQDNEQLSSFRYSGNHFSSDVPSSDIQNDEDWTPRPSRKRTFAAYSSDTEELSLSQSANPAAARYQRAKRRSLALERAVAPNLFQSQVVQNVVNEAIENGKTHVDLSQRNLTVLPDVISDLNLLVSASQGISMKPQLRLFLSRNRLKTLPESLFELKELEFLSLSGNKLKTLSSSIGKLKNLVSLNVGLNQIEFLPASLLTLPKLEQLVFECSESPPSPAKSQPSQRKRRKPTLDAPPRSIRLSRRAKSNARVPTLYEYSLRSIRGNPACFAWFKDIYENYDLERFLVPLENRSFCDTCGIGMHDVYATREEHWSGFAGADGIPIRRNLCSLTCLEGAPQYEDSDEE
ncbi:hypothetical protein BCR37DRAFT_401319 [Protomyces lactucae-debilis]|uniref:Leucine-rich repeat-domain-containing protein n=1 Tax=Protomyces lactucae-debilis TaxID=2754530 RepID=A0A1Y2ESU2_PROLT|nr:uncharacterized protein BCR37DRAFT_401319 [Protomyces lactucae-debilis]ORY74617.1 hypothetical protein BCR37DRAFT_401319 [Protomyces lactucae-debilis]